MIMVEDSFEAAHQTLVLIRVIERKNKEKFSSFGGRGVNFPILPFPPFPSFSAKIGLFPYLVKE